MNKTSARILLLVALVPVAVAVACSSSTPLEPALPGSAPGATSSTIPQVTSPVDGETLSFNQQPYTLVVKNVTSTSKNTLTYTFEVATDQGFTTIVSTQSGVPQGANGQTSTQLGPLAAASTYYWRAYASDSGRNGPPMPTSSFTVGLEVVAPSKNLLDLRTANIVIGPSNIYNWQETAKISEAYFDPEREQLCIFHDRLGAWPPALFASDGTTVEGNQWVFGFINGEWYGGSADWYRPGQACKGLNAESIGRDAFYQTPQSPAYSWQPVSGEVYAVMVSTPSRQWPTFATYDERSDVVYLVWP